MPEAAHQGCCAAPVGDATTFGHVVVHVIHRACVDQAAHAVHGNFALAGGGGHADRLAHSRHHHRVVVPQARLFKPCNVEMLDQPRKADRVLRVPAAIGIDADHEILAHGLARHGHAFGIVLGRQTAHLELAARHAGFFIRLDFLAEVGELLARHVIPAYGNDRQRVSITAEQLPHRFVQRLAHQIPDRAVHARNRFQQHFALALRGGEREHFFPDALVFEKCSCP